MRNAGFIFAVAGLVLACEPTSQGGDDNKKVAVVDPSPVPTTVVDPTAAPVDPGEDDYPDNPSDKNIDEVIGADATLEMILLDLPPDALADEGARNEAWAKVDNQLRALDDKQFAKLIETVERDPKLKVHAKSIKTRYQKLERVPPAATVSKTPPRPQR